MIYHWDFFGPAARTTAEHFQRHLGAFLAAHGLACDTGVGSGGAGHHEVWCAADEAQASVLVPALRPRRATPDPDGSPAPPG